MPDAVLDRAADDDMEGTVIGMSHRGRLNVLANTVGKSYGEIFGEFEGNLDPTLTQGSGDVKYHLGSVGKHVARSGKEVRVEVASNPSHLEAVNPVVEGIARARQDQLDRGEEAPVLPILIHGDAAFAGQGVVAETLNLSQLRGYRTGGTVHIVVNNQVGFTTSPDYGRSSTYATDVAKMIQAPIFHVNGDDPEACVRVARLAFAFRQEFKKMSSSTCVLPAHGHNEADEPSFTQPLMYERIKNRRPVRKLYTEALVNRGDLSLEDAERSLEQFRQRLQQAFDDTHDEEDSQVAKVELERPAPMASDPAVDTTVDRATLDQLLVKLTEVPDGFNVHPKLVRWLEQRAGALERNAIDWALGEALALGSLLTEGRTIRLSGQDTRRGTSSQRHSVLVDQRRRAVHRWPGRGQVLRLRQPAQRVRGHGLQYYRWPRVPCAVEAGSRLVTYAQIIVTSSSRRRVRGASGRAWSRCPPRLRARPEHSSARQAASTWPPRHVATPRTRPVPTCPPPGPRANRSPRW
jgi:2-oxoglutarate dehydrogenase E1 component